jgi:hypothetical protein
MSRLRLPACLSVLLAASAALAQNEPIRVFNRAALPATALHVVRPGAAGWGANLLNQGALRPGAFFALRLGDGAGCRFDLRLVLQDGQEILRRDADVCAERSIDMAAGPAPATAPAPPLPQVGGGDVLLPRIERARRE